MSGRQLNSVVSSVRSVAMVRRHKPDYRIVLYMGLLMMLGLIIMFAIGPQRAQVLNAAYGSDYDGTYFFARQAFSLVMAVAVFFVIAKVPITWLQANAKRGRMPMV
jgi:cell division protein FtsW (lipid II flippase)